jgi:hypothetical protein
MSQLYISRSHVRKSLASAAMARTWITVAAAAAVLALVGITYSTALRYAWAALPALVIVPLLAWWIATTLLCRNVVECPACKGSLWEVGSGGFMPNQVKIKDEVTNCPHCGAVLL